MTTTPVPPLPDAATMDALFESLKNWGRWGDDDRGTLALLTPEHRAAAGALARSGSMVSLAHDLTWEGTVETPVPAQHEMLACGHNRSNPQLPGYEASRDAFGSHVHGMGVTHLDALCHIFVRGVMFNGLDADLVTDDGALRNSVMPMADGVVGRGVLLDIPAALGLDFVPPERPIVPADLDAAIERQDSAVGTGDLLVISTGRDARRAASGGVLDPFASLAGLHPACLPWLRDRDVALLGSDGISDPMPAGPIPGWPFPIHQVGIAAIGLALVDNLRLDDLIETCRAHQRWEYLLCIAPLRLPGATGCPVNPIAIF